MLKIDHCNYIVKPKLLSKKWSKSQIYVFQENYTSLAVPIGPKMLSSSNGSLL